MICVHFSRLWLILKSLPECLSNVTFPNKHRLQTPWLISFRRCAWYFDGFWYSDILHMSADYPMVIYRRLFSPSLYQSKTNSLHNKFHFTTMMKYQVYALIIGLLALFAVAIPVPDNEVVGNPVKKEVYTVKCPAMNTYWDYNLPGYSFSGCMVHLLVFESS